MHSTFNGSFNFTRWHDKTMIWMTKENFNFYLLKFHRRYIPVNGQYIYSRKLEKIHYIIRSSVALVPDSELWPWHILIRLADVINWKNKKFNKRSLADCRGVKYSCTNDAHEIVLLTHLRHVKYFNFIFKIELKS